MGIIKKIAYGTIICIIIQCNLYSIPWKEKAFHKTVQEEKLSYFIKEFSFLHGISCHVHENVVGTISGEFSNSNPSSLWERLVEENGLHWYFDGVEFYVQKAVPLDSLIIKNSLFKKKELESFLKEFGYEGNSFRVQSVPSTEMLLLRGVPSFIEKIKPLISELEKKFLEESNQTQKKHNNLYRKNPLAHMAIKLVPLNYAWAMDISYPANDQSITIPGVASLLTKTFVSPRQFKKRKSKKMAIPKSVHKRQGSLMSVVENSVMGSGLDDVVPEVDPIVPMFTSIPNLNAVLIKGLEKHMESYIEIVKLLDKPTEIIEIKAVILDIQVQALSSLGLNSLGLVDGVKNYKFVTKDVPLASEIASNIGFTAIVNGNELLSRIQALSQSGLAKVGSQPMVTTLENMEAYFERKQEFFIPVQGERVSDLYDVSTGTVLKVLPRVIREGMPRIKLDLFIKDGRTSDIQVSTIPVVEESIIKTQAVIPVDKSLLIGGYFRQNEADTNRGIPKLKDIPILGWAFKSREKENSTLLRLLLITPRIITLDQEKMIDYSKPSEGMLQEYWWKGTNDSGS